MRRFRAILARENIETAEGWLHRHFPAGCFDWREPPLVLRAGGSGGEHEGAEALGRIDTIDRLGDLIIAFGVVDDEGEGAAADNRRDIIRQIEQRIVNSISVDPGGVETTETCIEEDEDGFCTQIRLTFDRYTIGAATVVHVPALGGTFIELDPVETAAVAASAGPVVTSIPDTVPVEWLAEPPDLPGIDEPGSRIPRVTEDGRVFGYLCFWQDCHISFASYCQPPWHSASQYAYAHHCGPFQTDEGQPVHLSPIAVEGGHFPTAGEAGHDWRGAQAHYDDPTACVAYVRFGENEHGVWYSGVIREGATAEQLALLTRHQLSGDWRRPDQRGGMELVGACSVNTPGFVRSIAVAASAAEGGQEVIAAVIGQGARAAVSAAATPACGCVTATLEATEDDRLAAVERTLAVLTETLGPQVRATLRARLAAV